jgi:type IV pilus assembly protein PilM
LGAVADFPRAEAADAVTAEEAAGIREHLTASGFAGNEAVLAVPAGQVMTGIMELPPRESGVPIEQIARREMARLHRCEPASIELACWDLPRPARAANVTLVMGVACANDDANRLLDAFEAGGLRVRRLDVHASAAARACRATTMSVTGIVGILDLAWTVGRLVLCHQDVVVYERDLAHSGLGALVAATAKATGAEAAQAEQALFSQGLAAEPAEGERATAGKKWLQSLVDEMQIPLSYLGSQYPDSPVQKLVLIGGGAAIPGLAERLGAALRLPVQVAAPADVADCASAELTRSGPGATFAVGLAQP